MSEQQYIGKYQIEQRLGSGTFATVYRCHDPDLDTTCAIKLLAENWSEDESARNWFLNEARVMFGIEHPAILRIFTSGTLDDDRPYFVMEYADQGSLADRIRSRRAQGEVFDIHEALDISIAVADGLIVAHDRELVHRDLKPSNILFRTPPDSNGSAEQKDHGPQIKIADFGLARRLEQGANSLAGAGTPHYIAPEQAKGLAEERPDVRNDVYSAATILYEMVAGQVPFPYKSMTQVIAAHLNEEPAAVQDFAPQVPDEMAKVIHDGLAREPEDRIPTAQAWKQQLQVLRNSLNPDGSIAGWISAAPMSGAAAADAPSEPDPVDDETKTIPIGSVTNTRVLDPDEEPAPLDEIPAEETVVREERSNPMAMYVIAAAAIGLLVVGMLGLALSDLVNGGNGSGTTDDTALIVDVNGDDSAGDAELAVPDDSEGSQAGEEPTSTVEPTETPRPEPSPTPDPTATPEPEEDPAVEPIRAILEELPGDSSGVIVLPSGEIVDESGDQQVPAGGTISLWIAAATFDAASSGDLDLDDTVTITEDVQAPGTGMLNSSEYLGDEFSYEEIIGIMLLHSDNSASNILTEAIGGMSQVNEYAEDHGYESTRMQRMLGALDPEQENYTSATDGALFMTRLLDDQIVDPEASEQLRSILEQRSNNETVALDFFGRELPDDAAHANISGLLPATRNEIGYILLTDDGRFVVISLMSGSLDDESGGEAAIAAAIAEIHAELLEPGDQDE